MNAALQALAHAPELCHALDAECHVRNCPVALRNERRRRRRILREQQLQQQQQEQDQTSNRKGGSDDAQSNNSDEELSIKNSPNTSSPSRDNKKSSKKRRTSRDRKRSASRDRKSDDETTSDTNNGGGEDEEEFCTLCEVERLLGRVHSRPDEVIDDPLLAPDQDVVVEGGGSHANLSLNGGDPSSAADSLAVVPEAFVSGFMYKVAPWFRRGVQEDSHEFLRLLIDAMQNSCKEARSNSAEEHNRAKEREQDGSSEEDAEYPFRLFRGTVESNVKCSACRSISRKIDPIEDIGLDILPVRSNANAGRSGGSSRGASSSSRSTSPTTPSMGCGLADLQQALERFISIEHLDSGYKCENCGRLGKATKTSRLASIPPILTLHLKRFRYGSMASASVSTAGGNSNGGSSRSSRAARGTSTSYADPVVSDYVGPSGSAKIEGHVPFRLVLDMKPYLTPELQSTIFKKAFCRLFAVVVHTGKNSHSGHYVAYVCNVSKNEWWKMDDAKVIRASWGEVERAEAYMLFYRVMDHPVAKQLKADAEAKAAAAAKAVAQAEAARLAAQEEQEAIAAAAVKAAAIASGELEQKSAIKAEGDKIPDVEASSNEPVEQDVPIGKRKRPDLASGEEWAMTHTSLPEEFFPLFRRIEEFIEENVTFNPEFFRYITEEYNRMSSKLGGGKGKNNKKIKSLLGNGPSGVYPPEDVQGGAQDIREGILDLFHQISIMYKSTVNRKDTKSSGLFLVPKKIEEFIAKDEPPVQTVLPTLTVDDELIIPDPTESYDGAL